MHTFNNEKTILTIIKYGAVIPIIIFSVIITYFLIEQKNKELKEEINLIRTKYLQDNKKEVKNEVQRVINSINNEIEKTDESLKIFLKNKVYEAHNIASNIYNERTSHEAIGKEHSKDHIFQTIKHALGGMIYNNGRGYIFIDDIHGTKVLQPLNKKIEGKNFLEYEDAKGYKLVKKIVQTIKNKSETYDQYYWYKSGNDSTAYKKISFYKYFEPYDVIIGTGEYLVDFEKELKTKLLKRIKNIKFGDNGYIFIFNKKGKYLAHFQDEKIGTNGFKVKDSEGKHFIKEFVNYTLKSKKGYYSYIASAKPKEETSKTEKISYLEHFEKWDWIIGAGFYLEELNNNIKNKEKALIKKNNDMINSIILVSLSITIILLLISFYASKIISKKFNTYKNDIKNEIEKTIEKEKLLVQQSKMATMGEMIANISHQWRQPLSTISTAATGSKLQKELGTLSDEQFEKSMDAINNSAQYLSQTIEDFRNFFQPSKEEKDFKISRLFEKISKLLASQFKTHDIKIVKNINDCQLTAHENELLQVIINILKNAKDELAKKQRDEKKFIFIDAKQEKDKIIIDIKDNAGGIDLAIIDKVFAPYFTTKQAEEGTGIGLYMSKQIIDNMNGELLVDNVKYTYEEEEHIGAVFTIKLKVNDGN